MKHGIALARTLLSGQWWLRAHSVRAAAWVARTVLEDALRALVRAKGVDPGRGNTTSMLISVGVLYGDDPQVAFDAEYAWLALSRACHQHAYEFAPTHGEVQSLIDMVERLVHVAEARETTAPTPMT